MLDLMNRGSYPASAPIAHLGFTRMIRLTPSFGTSDPNYTTSLPISFQHLAYPWPTGSPWKSDQSRHDDYLISDRTPRSTTTGFMTYSFLLYAITPSSFSNNGSDELMACDARKYSSARFDEESWRYSIPIKSRGKWDLEIISLDSLHQGTYLASGTYPGNNRAEVE